MAEPRPDDGMRDFIAAGGSTVVGEGRLAGRLASALTRARSALPSAAAFAASPAVACIPVGTRPERSLALRAAVALGMSAIVVCPIAPGGAMAAPSPQVAAPSPGSADAAARQRAHAIMSAFTPLTQHMAEELHPDILQVMALARKRSGIDFEIVPGTGGKRTLEMQRALVSKGASKTMTSRHTTGLALDIVPVRSVGNVKCPNFFDKQTYYKVDAAMRAAATELGIKLTTGLDFKSFPDLGHFELEKHSYAAYSPSDASVRTVVVFDGTVQPNGAPGHGQPVDPSATGRVRVAQATPVASGPAAALSTMTPGSAEGSSPTPGSGTSASATPRRSPARGVPEMLADLRPSADAGDEAPVPRM